MSLRSEYAWVASRAIDGTTTTLDFETNGYPFVLIEVLSSSSLSVKAGLMGKVGVDRKIRSMLLSGASTETIVDPDTATGTVAVQDFIIVPTLGAKRVRITRAAGSGTIQGVPVPLDAVAPWLAMKQLDAGLTVDTSTLNTLVGAVNETAPATDTASSGLNGRLQRIAQRITSLIALLPTALAALGGLKVEKIGVSVHSFIVDGTDELLISAAARRVYGLNATHRDATPISIKLYDKATAASEADTPVWRGQVPANATAALAGGANYTFPEPLVLTNGLSIRAVVGAADADDTALTSGEAEINTFWSA